ncbi:MAG: threonine/serine dehydratase [Alphaproteobacteria bacterium]|nr:threonine/serine dehydratase [Alphaproteobacteria bacterium]
MTDAPIDRTSIDAAAQRIAGRVRTTPILDVPAGELAPCRVVLKLECLQHTGSFKPRGAFNRLLSAADNGAGVIAASGGNHGIAVAYAAQSLGRPADIFVPEISSPVKVARLREMGANVYQTGQTYADALEAMQRRREETGALEAHAYDQPETVRGQGTAAREFDAQAPDLTTLLVAVGGGGLIGGFLGWFGDTKRVVSVEPETAPTLSAALEAGRPVDVAVSGVAADSLGARRIGGISYGLAAQHLAESVLVPDDAIRAAQRLLWDRFRVVAEPGGATALAALTAGRYTPRTDEVLGVLVCGANADLTTLTEA